MDRKNLPFSQIYDIRAIRIIVDTVPECYQAFGIIHNIYHAIPGEFDDYISAPKENSYRSLHTAVLDQEGKTLEVQIRTSEMDEEAEYRYRGPLALQRRAAPPRPMKPLSSAAWNASAA